MKLHRGRVLMIEGPDPEANEQLRIAVACGRYDPVPAVASEALLLADQVDCILIDAATPTSDEPLRLLSEIWCLQPDLPAVVIIDGDLRMKERSLRAGATAVLTTPFAEIELRAALLMASQQREMGLSSFTREIARTMSSVAAALEEERGLQASLEEIANLFHVKRASILLFGDAVGVPAWNTLCHPKLCIAADEEPDADDHLRTVAFLGLPFGVARNIRVKIGEGIAGGVAKEGIPRLLLRRVTKVTNTVSTDDTREQIHAGVSVPIRAAGERGHGRVLGVLSVSRTEAGEIFTPRDLEICEFLAAHIGQVLSRRALDDEQADLQHRLAATEKLSYAGELAAGIAHEVASPIGYVRANVRALGEYLEDLAPILDAVKASLRTGRPVDVSSHLDQADEFVEILDDINDLVSESRTGMERATQIVNDMKAMVRIGGTDEPMEPVEMTSLIESSLRLLRPRLLDACVVETELEADLIAHGREVELSQVVVNLVVNASDACVERANTISEKRELEGNVDDTAAGRRVFQPRVRVRTEREGECVILTVEDNGVGIPKQKVQSIFAPLFTTKPKGVGTGLGLGIVQRIIGAHDGHIKVTSDLGVGTTFRISLPVEGAAKACATGDDDTNGAIANRDAAPNTARRADSAAGADVQTPEVEANESAGDATAPKIGGSNGSVGTAA